MKEIESSVTKVKGNKRGFTMIDNHIINDESISAKALGLFTILWSKPDNWKFFMKNIMSHCSDKKDALYSGLKELEKEGYLRRKKLYSGKQIIGMHYTLCDMGEVEQYTLSENPPTPSESDNPPRGVVGKSDRGSSDNPTDSNTKLSNTNSLVKDKSSTKPKVGDEEGLRLGTKLIDMMCTLRDNFKPLTSLEKTSEAISLMIRIDKRSESSIETIIEWLYSGTKQANFWKNNILSGKKLREQYERLMLEMDKDKFVWNKSGVSKEKLHAYLLKEFGNSKAVMQFKREGKLVRVALFGEHNVLADFNTGKYLSEKESNWLWDHMITNHETLFPSFIKGL